MSESLDRRLSLTERIKLKLHFLVCAWCKRYQKQISLLRNVVSLSAEDLESNTPGLSVEAMERISQSLERR